MGNAALVIPVIILTNHPTIATVLLALQSFSSRQLLLRRPAILPRSLAAITMAVTCK